MLTSYYSAFSGKPCAGGAAALSAHGAHNGFALFIHQGAFWGNPDRAIFFEHFLGLSLSCNIYVNKQAIFQFSRRHDGVYLWVFSQRCLVSLSPVPMVLSTWFEVEFSRRSEYRVYVKNSVFTVVFGCAGWLVLYIEKARALRRERRGRKRDKTSTGWKSMSYFITYLAVLSSAHPVFFDYFWRPLKRVRTSIFCEKGQLLHNLRVLSRFWFRFAQLLYREGIFLIMRLWERLCPVIFRLAFRRVFLCRFCCGQEVRDDCRKQCF